ncbi:cbb3-type cytochrome c oxidase subunit III [Lacibacter cauensis]|uniref:Cbb3-type cytochrome c oxidase subunit III n=1 Tax=Lacibacter cauensis TaxID=510947 RepID=A0A562SPC6_9BACT|nr:cytochrome c [Lacibacter cauensis]TWI83102.1 cbb3-type cytochrome c oxidase subunit III [Lacibacter cauensis]
MRSTKIVTLGLVTVVLAAAACNNGPRREPGKIYMPDMAYSRAVETYADHSNLTEAGIYYDATPVAGTVKRGGVASFPLAKDAAGDTANYVASKQVVNPLPALNEKDMAEAKRLYNVNCGICHGEKLDGNGPIYKGGDGPYPAKPATLVGDAKYENMPAGQMMYSVTYGKNLMGSYASQLSTKQRWMVIHYVKSMQPGGVKPVAAADTTAKPAADTTVKATK